ncbi:MAG TPA: hypothetical protein VFP15_12215 [Gemmatimonadaceae bacterium]|nr:hypothetical protein [Gemmatimonadaceae bacterium]
MTARALAGDVLALAVAEEPADGPDVAQPAMATKMNSTGAARMGLLLLERDH